MSEDAVETQPLPKALQVGEEVIVAGFSSGVVTQSFNNGDVLDVEVEARAPLEGKMFVTVSKDIVTSGG